MTKDISRVKEAGKWTSKAVWAYVDRGRVERERIIAAHAATPGDDVSDSDGGV